MVEVDENWDGDNDTPEEQDNEDEEQHDELTDEEIAQIIRDGKRALNLINGEEITWGRKSGEIDLENPTRYCAITMKGFKPEIWSKIELYNNLVNQYKEDNKELTRLMYELLDNNMEYTHRYKGKVISRIIGKCDRLVFSNKLFDCYDTITGYVLIVSEYGWRQ
jgi:hypothetical protein